MKFILTFLFGCFLSYGSYAQYWTRTNASIAATGSDARMLAANCGDTIYGVTKTTQGYFLTVSQDKGATWSAGQNIFDTLIDGFLPEISALYGVHNRLYAHVKLSTSFANIYYYTDDLGATWTVDTVGMARSYNPAYVHSVEISALSNGYMVAYNSLQGAYFKHITDQAWVHRPTSSSWTGTYNLDFTYSGNTWYALNNAMATGEVLNVSTDFGQTWSTTTISGIPSTFAPYNLVGNHNDKLYLSGSIAGSNANLIFYSTDNGATWDTTNSATYGQYNLASVYLRDLFAVEDYVFATFYPTTGDTVSRILSSNTSTPSFSLANVSGLPVYPANLFVLGPPSLNYFSIGDKLFITYADDIYSSTPGFNGSSGIGIEEQESKKQLTLYPNPSTGSFTVQLEANEKLIVYNTQGEQVYTQYLYSGENLIDLSLKSGLYFVKVGETSKQLLVL